MVNGYVRQSAGTIVTGNTIQASDFNNEYNALQSAFNASTGHTHDGTTGAGAPITTGGLSGLTSSTSGIVAANGAGALVGRTITAGANITVTNGTGVSGNPTIAVTGIGSTLQAWDADLDALAALSTTGIVSRTGSAIYVPRTITGTSGTITVTNGDGVSGNPTLTIDSSYIGQNTITTLGTITTGVWTGTTISVAKGGTGQTSYTDGQLLIGNSTGNTLVKASLTAPAAGLTITGGSGSITFALANDLSALEAMSSTGLVTRTASETYAQRTLTGTANQITVTNGDGVSGNPTISIPNSPVFTTPNIGVATATTVNKVTITAPATGSTLVIADGKTLTVSNTLTFTGTDTSSVAFGAGGTVCYIEDGTWTVTDQSGASLALTTTTGVYKKRGTLVYAQFAVTFPSTSSSAQVTLSLPFAAATTSNDGCGGGFIVYTNSSVTDANIFALSGQAKVFIDNSAGSNVLNSSFSTKELAVVVMYHTTS